jgi:hypothetical protein
MTQSEFLEKFSHFINDDEVMFADGFDDAIVGLEPSSLRVIYDINSMVLILTKDDEMTTSEAIEYLEYNVLNAYVGEKTPIYIET